MYCVGCDGRRCGHFATLIFSATCVAALKMQLRWKPFQQNGLTYSYSITFSHRLSGLTLSISTALPLQLTNFSSSGT